MALGTDHFTGAAGDLDVYIPEIWGEKINDFFKKKLRMGSFFTDRSGELAGGGDTLYTPGITEMTTNAKANGSQVTLQSPTETRVTLVVNTWVETSFLVEDDIAAQWKQSYALQSRYARNAAYSVARALDTALAALIAGFSQSVGTAGTAITDAVVRSAIATLDANDVDLDECAFIMHPNAVWNEIQGIDKFSLVQNTAGADPVMQGHVGMLYGYPVMTSTNLATNGGGGFENCFAHPDALHFATASLSGAGAMGIRVQSNYIPEYLGTLTTADIKYGVIENRDDSGVRILNAA